MKWPGFRELHRRWQGNPGFVLYLFETGAKGTQILIDGPLDAELLAELRDAAFSVMGKMQKRRKDSDGK